MIVTLWDILEEEAYTIAEHFYAGLAAEEKAEGLKAFF